MAVPSSIHCWLESVISEILGYRGFSITKDDGDLRSHRKRSKHVKLINAYSSNSDLCRSMGACIFEASSTISTFHSSMYTRDYIQDDVVVIKKTSNMHFDQDLEEGALKKLFFISKSMKAPKRIIQIWFPEDVHPPKWAIERIEKHATKKGFESFIPAQDSSLRYAPYRGKRLYFRRTLNKDNEEDDLRYAPYRGKRLYFYRGKHLYFKRAFNKDDEEDDAKAKVTEDEVRDDDEEDDATNGA
ncbi:hypothetical protein Hanom_Chr16g01420161 [Helianthus anomalus]